MINEVFNYIFALQCKALANNENYIFSVIYIYNIYFIIYILYNFFVLYSILIHLF